MTLSNRRSRINFLQSVLKRRYGTGLAIGVPVMGLFALLAWLSPAHYRAVSKLKLLSVENEETKSAVQTRSLDDAIATLKSNPLITKTLETLKGEETSSFSKTPNNFKRSLSIAGNPQEQTITLFFDASKAKNAALSANTHMEVFQESQQQVQQSLRQQLKNQIDQRIPQAEANLDSIEQEIQKFQKQFQFITSTNSSSSAAVAYKQAQQELATLQQQNKVLEGQREVLLQKLGITANEAEVLSAVSRSKEFRKLIRELRQLQAQIKRKRSQLTEQHPEVIELKRDISNLKNGLQAEVRRVTGNQTIRLNLLLERENQQILTSELVELETQRATALGRAQTLNQSLGQLQKNALELPKIEKQSQLLEQQQDDAQKVLKSLLSQRREITQALNENAPGSQIIERAQIPKQKIAPFQQPLLWGGLITSLGLAGIGMWVAERRDRSLKTISDAEKYLGLKVLGVIPTFEAKENSQLYDGDLQRDIPTIFPVDQPGSSVSEAFRMLYLNLKVLPENRHLQSFAITSSIPQEGKSMIAANLAAVLAQAGQSVLLIDANLHNPFQSLIWNLSNAIGLSDILFSQTSFLLAVNPISSNLDVLTSGSIKNLDRNSFESKKMKLFIADMSSRYDCLIFDLPSVNVSADAAIISQMVDGVLFVSKPGQLDELNASKAQFRLSQTKANLLGMIINGSDDPQDTFLSQQEDDSDEISELPQLEGAKEVTEQEADFSNLGQTIPPQILELSQPDREQSLPELEHQLDELQSQWAASKRLLDSKEEELIHLCHARKELEIELNQMSLSLDTTEDRGEKLEVLHEKIRQTDSRREHLQGNIKSLREQIMSEQNTFYTHLKVLQSQHQRSTLT